MELRGIEDVIHSALEGDQAGLPAPRRRAAVELRKCIDHALFFEPVDHLTFFTIVEVACDQGGHSWFKLFPGILDFSHTIIPGDEITAEPSAAIADGRAEMNVQNLDWADT